MDGTRNERRPLDGGGGPLSASATASEGRKRDGNVTQALDRVSFAVA